MRRLDTLHSSASHRETFLDDDTPVDRTHDDNNLLPHDATRDSHDLSLNPDIRDSVVDHMLISLDSLPNGSSSYPSPVAALFNPSYRDNGLFDTSRHAPSNIGRRRKHSHTPSYLSDYGPDDEIATLRESHPPRRYASNSSFRSAFDSTDYSRNAAYSTPRYSPERRGGYRNSDSSTIGKRARGAGRASKRSSAASSVDYGHSSAFAAKGLQERPASFDHRLENSETRKPPEKDIPNSIMHRARPHGPDYSLAMQPAESAAPVGHLHRDTSNPNGFRDAWSSQFGPSYPTVLPKRRESLMSATSRLSRKSRHDSDMKWDASKDGHANDTRDQPVVSAHAHHPAAPSPTVGARTSSGTKIPSTNHNAANRDKPGFFRRVFGSSKNSSSAPQSQLSASAPSPTPPTSQDNAPPQTPKRSGTERSPQQTAAQLKGGRNSELLPRVSPDMTNDQPRIVQKKSSSFFRRRKKSTVEHTRPPLPAPHLQYGQPENAVTAGGQLYPQPSPSMSSLRKVMNPYLTEVDDATDTCSDPRERHLSASEVGTGAKRIDGLLQGSDQYRNATVRAVKPESKDANAEGSAPPSWDIDPSGGLQTSSDSPSTKYKLKLRSRRPPRGDDSGEGSFAASTANAAQTTSFIQQHSSHGLISENRSRPRTSPTFLKSTPQLDLGKENRAPQPQTRRANSGEKRLDMLSPTSDHSYVHSDTGERGASNYSSPLPDLLDDGWFVSKLQREQSLPRTESRTGRVWIDDDGDSFEQKLEDLTQLPLPWSEDAVPEKAISPVSAAETNDVFHSATSLPMVRVEGEEINDKPIKEDAAKAIAIEEAEPSADDRRAAEMIYSGDNVYVKRSGAAALLGEASFISARMRRAYMELFDWTGLNILSAFRNLCQRLIMKAESQALDRVIDAFSKRWCECNETHGFKASGMLEDARYHYSFTDVSQTWSIPSLSPFSCSTRTCTLRITSRR